MPELTLCQHCNEKLAPFRFDDGDTICRDCKRWRSPGKTTGMELSRFAHHTDGSAITNLTKLPGYKKWIDDWRERCAQVSKASYRGVGYVD